MRLLGIKINFDYNSETRVFATLLHHRRGRYDASVIYNCWEGSSQGVERFEDFAEAETWRVDTGWRPNPEGKRSLVGKAVSTARIHASLPKLLKRLAEFDPDVIYSCQQKYDCLVASYLAEKLKRPQIIHLHYVPGPWLGQQAMEQLKKVEHVVTVSDFIRHLAIRHGVHRDHVSTVRNVMPISPPVAEAKRLEIRAALEIPADTMVIGNVGRLTAGKGHADTINAFAKISKAFPDAHLVIVGGGDLETSLQAQAAALKLKERIHFTGVRSDVPDLLGSFDIFIHPTRMDPAPLAVLEACSSGLPVLAYEEGGVCEFIENGRTGLLTPPESVDGLARSMVALLKAPEQAKAMGQASRERVATRFRPEDVGIEFADLLERALP
ncbi:hypothetical protein LBMAG21_10880 [Armatimonadota bacterium]|nr:hypothetical protein LBMAG21_10880 [Armatimonadota bacterium]